MLLADGGATNLALSDNPRSLESETVAFGRREKNYFCTYHQPTNLRSGFLWAKGRLRLEVSTPDSRACQPSVRVQ